MPDIQAESGGDLKKLLSTNIPLVRVPVTSLMPATPTTITLYLYGNPRQFYAQCDALTNAQFYEMQVSQDQVTWPWKATSGKSAVGMTGLPAGEVLYVQMRITNAIGTSDWSDSVKFMIPASSVRIPKIQRPKGVR